MCSSDLVGSIEQDVTIRRPPNTLNQVSLAGSGDFNGDGISDILVESFRRNDIFHGTAYVFFGAPLRAPAISSVRFNGGASELILTGTDFSGRAQVQVNGSVLAVKPLFDRDQGTLTVEGSQQDLNLHSGKNKIVVIRGSARSNTVKLRL